jgi:hypothetical protein
MHGFMNVKDKPQYFTVLSACNFKTLSKIFQKLREKIWMDKDDLSIRPLVYK